jgi:putative MATE family efflux protein
MEQYPQENKMGVMPVGKLLFSMSLPMMLSMMVQALYNIVDSIFVSRIGEDALTALSMAFPLQNLMIAMVSGVGVGINALLSRALGAKQSKTVHRVATNGIFVVVVVALLFMVLGVVVSEPFFRLQTDIESIATYGKTYTSIVMIGSFGLFMQVLFERLLQSTGRTMLSMISQGTGAILNIILDPILIFGLAGMPKMGVAGAALATIIGQWVAAGLGLFMNLRHNPEVSISMKGFKPNLENIRDILMIGIPSAVMISIGSVMTFCLNQILIGFTATAVAVFGVYFKLQSFVFMPIFGLNNGTIPIVAYNYGAKKTDRMKKAIRYAIIADVTIMVAGCIVLNVFPRELLQMFDATEEMTRLGVPALRIISLSFPVAGFCIGLGTVFQAVGYSMYSMIISLIRQIFVLIPAAWILGRMTGRVDAVWWAFLLAEGASLTFSLYFYQRVRRNVIDPLEQEADAEKSTVRA